MKPNLVLQAILVERGITHVRLAEELGVSSQVVDVRCSGKKEMRVGTLMETYAAVGYKLVAMPVEGDGPEYELSAR